MDHSESTLLRNSDEYESDPKGNINFTESTLSGKALDCVTYNVNEERQYCKPMAAKDASLLSDIAFAKESALAERPMCRICHDGGGQEELLSPCECTGTLGTIHRSCLEHWLSASSTSFCELCHFQFSVQRKARPFLEWLRNPGLRQEKRTLFGDMVCFLLITPLATISGWLCLRGAVDHLHFSSRLEAVGLITLTVALFTIYLFWTLVSLRYHFRLYNEWRQSNQRVVLLLPKSHSESLGNSSRPGLLSSKRPSKETIVWLLCYMNTKSLDPEDLAQKRHVWGFHDPIMRYRGAYRMRCSEEPLVCTNTDWTVLLKVVFWGRLMLYMDHLLDWLTSGEKMLEIWKVFFSFLFQIWTIDSIFLSGHGDVVAMETLLKLCSKM